MDKTDWANVIRVIRKAPLKDMAEAEFVNGLLQKLAKHAQEQIESSEQTSFEDIQNPGGTD